MKSLYLYLGKDYTTRPTNTTLTAGTSVTYLSRTRKTVLVQTMGRWFRIPTHYLDQKSLKLLPVWKKQ